MKVVAFSYEIGSFGKSIAMDLAQNAALTLHPFREVYELAQARNERFRRRRQEVVEGRAEIDIWEGHFFHEPSFTSLFEALVLELAGRGDVILVGAAVQAVLREVANIILVHVRAPLPVRVSRFMELNGLTVAEANQTVRWWDQRRRAIFEINARFEDLPGSCDLIINSDRVSIPAASRLLQTLVAESPGPADPAAWRARLAQEALAKRVECAVRERHSALGLAPLEVRPSEEKPETLILTGFIHRSEDQRAILAQARAAAEGREVIAQLKELKLHGDLMPAHLLGGPRL
ncbi:MAG: cytidylate kinase-like family protein [Candidatus Adiutrix sp.]|jgi:hypothetical protein|nr:cytidylate kinase-like family protein [Candidatus Adiutrix sp.]